MGFAVWLRHKAPADDERGTRQPGRSKPQSWARRAVQHPFCCCPLHAQLAFVEVRKSVPPSHTALQSPPNLACFPSASAS